MTSTPAAMALRMPWSPREWARIRDHQLLRREEEFVGAAVGEGVVAGGEDLDDLRALRDLARDVLRHLLRGVREAHQIARDALLDLGVAALGRSGHHQVPAARGDPGSAQLSRVDGAAQRHVDPGHRAGAHEGGVTEAQQLLRVARGAEGDLGDGVLEEHLPSVEDVQVGDVGVPEGHAGHHRAPVEVEHVDAGCVQRGERLGQYGLDAVAVQQHAVPRQGGPAEALLDRGAVEQGLACRSSRRRRVPRRAAG